MLVLIDDANLEAIQELYRKFPYDGVTTNPSILAKEGKNPLAQLKAIRQAMPKESTLHAQVVSTTAEEIVTEAEYMLEHIAPDLYIKIPTTPEGLQAMYTLYQKGIHVTGTAVYTPMQAFLAVKAGAKFVAPYVNRLDNLGYDGVQLTKDMHQILTIHGMPGKVLAASFKNSQQVLDLCKYGIGAVTVSPDVLGGLIKNKVIDNAIADFTKDFEKLIGTKGATMLGL